MSHSIACRVRQGFASIALARGFWCAGLLFLMGCEAPLDLQRVEANRENPVHRFDEFQDGIAVDGRIIVAGLDGVVLESADQGANWHRSVLTAPDGPSPSLIAITACPSGFVAMLDFNRRLWTREKGGQEWTQAAIPTSEDVLALTCDAADRLWVVGGFSLILRSSDGGETWEDTSIGEDAMLTSVSFADAETGFIAGEFGTVLKSVDGGESWEAVTPVPNGLYVQAALFSGPETGWVVGLNGLIYRTEDAGETWTQEPTTTQAPLYRLAHHEQAMFAAGNYGTVLHNDGEGWQMVARTAGTVGYIRALIPLGEGRLLIGGAGLVDVISTHGVEVTSIAQTEEAR